MGILPAPPLMRDNWCVPRALPDGIYEHVVTAEIERALAAIDPSRGRQLASLTDADGHVALAQHLGREVERTLGALPQRDRAAAAAVMIGRLLDTLAELVTAHDLDPDAVRDQRVAAPPQRLLAIHRGTAPRRPATPLATSTLLTRNRAEPALGQELAREIETADRVDTLVAFVTIGGVRVIIDALEGFSRRAITGDAPRMRVLTTTFTGTTELQALDMLARLPGVAVKVSYDVQRTRLHAKAWLFHRDTGLSTAYVGSANLTHTALGSGHEWMVKACAADLPHVIEKFAGTFECLWADPEFEPYDATRVEDRERLRLALGAERERDSGATTLVTLRPFPFQEEILARLAAERAVHGRRRNLVVAATGTGKTVIAAFDYARIADAAGIRPRLLFLAHRRELLVQARDTFRHVLQDAAFGELVTGGDTAAHFEHLFATIQSVASGGLLDRLGVDHWRHVVVDECHHMPAATYQAIVPRLRPDTLVGLTATPERSDGKPLAPDFDDHIGAELRLWHALERELLVPFEYYGLSDGVDLAREARWTRTGYDLGSLARIYTGNDRRADLVVAQLARRVADLRRVRALGFCVSVEHAEFMAQRFTARGVPALAVHGGSTAELRDDAPRRLRDREVNVLFTCDLYNEGVDLPFVDTLLLLRPTASATLFMQQLGRGLRLHPQKATCLVLDFIGKHHDEFRFDTVLSALTGVARARLRHAVEQGFPFLPTGCTLQLDAVAREQILASLRTSVSNAQRLATELRETAAATTEPITLRRFLDETGRELSDVYQAGGWTTLRRRAGHEAGDDEATTKLSAALQHVLHVDEQARLRSWAAAVERAGRGEPAVHDADDRARLYMLDYQLQHKGVLRAAEATAAELGSNRAIAREFGELCDVLDDQVTLCDERYPVAAWPLALHRHYKRREILAAVGKVVPGGTKISHQLGILKLDGQRELLFVTLDKSDGAFSPTTRYRDYAISRELFHWESQGALAVDSPTARRYLDSARGRDLAGNGWSFQLFARLTNQDAFAYLGPIYYQSHEGDRPIAITWRLAHPLPAALYQRYRTLLTT